MKNVLGVLLMMCTVLFWMGCEKDPVDPNNNNNNSGGSGYSMTKISGDNQTDTINLQLSQALKVQVQDSLGAATQGVSVNYSISIGGGSLSAATVTTDANGFAEVLWTLGAATGTQTVSATASVTVGSPLSFSATALAASTGGNSPCPPTFGTMTDARDGEVYQTVTICNQTWMAENLRYNASGSWLNSANPSTTYGRHYDWATVMNGSTTSSSNPSGVQGICPSGWHLPSDSEWNEMEMGLGMPAADTANTGYRGTHGTGMKATTGWSSGGATNTSGFNAFPAGMCYSGSFYNLVGHTYFWSSTENSSTNAWVRDLNYGCTGVYRDDYSKMNGYSCRCAKD